MADTVHESLTKVVGELKESNKRFSTASNDLVRATGNIQGVGKEIGKSILEESGLKQMASSLMNLPFAGLAKSLSLMGWNKLKQKREDTLLAKQLGFTKEQITLQRKQFELVKARESQIKAMKDAAESLGLNGDAIKGIMANGVADIRDQNGRFLSQQGKEKAVGINQSLTPAQVEKFREEQRAQARQTSILESMSNGIQDLKKSFMDGIKKLGDKGSMGLGVLVGILAAPIITLVSFFKSLSVELKFLNKLTGGRLFKLFEPLQKFFTSIGSAFKGTGFLGRIGKAVKSVVDFIGKLFAPVIRLARGSASFMSGLAPIMKFAASIGRVLGKIFLPVTVLMSVFDFVTGFMEGYQQDGIIGGIREGIISVVDGLVGGLIRMITGAVAWILDLIGLDKFAASLTQNVNEALEGIYEAFRGIFDVVKGIFTFDLALIGSGLASITDGIIEVVTAPFDMLYGLVQDIFGLLGFDLPDFDLADFIKGIFNSVISWVTTLFTDPMAALSSLWNTLLGGFDSIAGFFSSIVSAPINWILGMFGWDDPENPFSLWDFIKGAVSSVWDWFTSLFTFDFSSIGETLFSIGNIMKGLAKGGWAAIKAMLPGGDSPGEAFTRVYNDVVNGGAGNYNVEEMEAGNAEAEAEMEEIRDRIRRSQSGENVYWGRDDVGRMEDAVRLQELQQQVAERTERLTQAQIEANEIARTNAQPAPVIVTNAPTTNNISGGGGGGSAFPVSVGEPDIRFQAVAANGF